MFGNDKIGKDILEDKFLQKQLAELICQFNYNKDLLSIYGVKTVTSKDVDELFPKLMTVKFIDRE
jgi:hypothetical protein